MNADEAYKHLKEGFDPMSESLVCAAILKVQEEVKDPVATSDNPFFKSKYVELPDLLEHLRPALIKNNLSVSSHVVERAITPLTGTGEIKFQTHLEMTVALVFEAPKADNIQGASCDQIIGLKTFTYPIYSDGTMQSLGGATTYARRMLLKSVFNLGERDDDGNGTNRAPTPNHSTGAQPSNAKPRVNLAPVAKPTDIRPAQTPPPLEAGDPGPTAEDFPHQALVNEGAPPDVGGYVIDFGKFKGKELSEFKTDQDLRSLQSFVQWLEGESKKAGKPLVGNKLTMVENSKIWINMNLIPF